METEFKEEKTAQYPFINVGPKPRCLIYHRNIAVTKEYKNTRTQRKHCFALDSHLNGIYQMLVKSKCRASLRVTSGGWL